MKKLQGDCVSWLVFLIGAAQLLLVCGEDSPGIICQPLFPYPYGVITYHPETPPFSCGTRATYSVSCPPELQRSGGDDVRTCTTNGNSAVGVWSGAAPICAARGVFLSFQGITYTTNNSNIVLTRIETTNDTSLTCHTDSTTCCRGVDSYSSMGTGEWLFPDGTSIVRKKRVPGDGFYYTRFPQAIRLYRNNDTQTPLGTYCCRIPDSASAYGEIRTFCTNLIDKNIRCPSDSVMAPTNGMVSYSSPVEGGSYVFGTVATFSCSPGFGLSTIETRTCTGPNGAEIGTFSGLSPACDAIVCRTLLDIPNGFITYATDNIPDYELGTVATYACDPGFVLDLSLGGSEMRTCVDDMDNDTIGVFDRQAPRCIPIECPPLPAITNGFITYATDTAPDYELGTVATYACDAGFVLDLSLGGSEIRTCVDDNGLDAIGEFDRQEPRCILIECPPILDITNGLITYAPDNTPNYGLGTVATYACGTGFVLDLSLGGSEMRTCVDDMDNDAEGVFDEQAPTCVRIICQPLFLYPYGMITYHHETPPYSYGTRARYVVSCPPELERRGGDDERTCTDNRNSAVGVWSGAAPICAAQGVFLSFQGTTYTTNNSNIVLTRIETTNDTSLVCHTDSTTCCRAVDSYSGMGTGEWLFPNGTSIVRKKRVPDDGFYYTRFPQAIRLYRNNDIQTPLGTYCCRIPDSGGEMRTFCANLIDNTIRCPSDSIMAPINGMVSYSSPVEGGGYVFGTVATFSCSPGFGLSALETRTCTGTIDAEMGTFNGSSPICDGITCPALRNVFNGTIVYSPFGTTEVFNYGTTATYQCNPGYKLIGGDNVKICTGNGSISSGRWDGATPQCPPVDCNTPPSITNGSPGIPTTTTFTGTVTYSCNDGYALFGIATSTCQANAAWSRPPECRAIVCPPLPAITNSTISYSPDVTPDYDLGTEATYTCEAGFYLEGNEVRVCMDDDGIDAIGVWSGQEPSCVSITCPRLPDHTYTSITYSTDTTPPFPIGTQAMYIISCPEGLERDGGDDVRTCTSYDISAVGVWSGTAPNCTAQKVYLSHGNTHYYANNTAIIISRIMTTNDTSLTCHTDSTTCCRGVDNGDPSSNMGTGEWLFPNGTSIVRQRVTGSGFYYTRFHQVIRLYRQGNAQTPLGTYCCRIPDCGGERRTFCANLVATRCAPLTTAPDNGRVIYSNQLQNDNFIFGTIATYTCPPGYVLNSTQGDSGITTATTTCMADGNWEPLPICIIVNCGDPPTLFNGSPGIPTPGTAFGGTVSYTCNNRYHISGSATVTCEASGSWSTRPTCSAICEDLHHIENGYIIHNPDTTPRTEGAIALYSCVSGYQLSGVSIRICMDGHRGIGGAWTGSTPSCIAICDGLTLDHGVISYSPSTTPRLVGSVATHSCDEGYGLSPSVTTRTCQPDRTWSGEDITCQSITCPPLTHPHGLVIHSSPPLYPFGTQARYSMLSCPDGTEPMGGDYIRTCTGDGHSTVGVWNGTAPVCAGQPVFMSLRGLSYSANNSNILVTRIGTTQDSTLICHTDSTTCCRGENNPQGGSGEWLFPNGTMITESSITGDGFYWSRYYQVLRLYRQGDIQSPLGRYCCRIPNRHGDVMSVCVNLTANNIRCPSDSVMAPTNGMVSYSSPSENNSYTDGTVATFSCFTGFSLDVTSTRTCETEQGKFSGTTPSCIAITCSVVPAIANGIVVYSSDTPYDYGTTAVYQCNDGYSQASGDIERTCTGDGTSTVGQWNGAAPQCPPVDCGAPLSITNGSRGIPTRQTFGGIVTYSCNDGYTIFGIATSTCQAAATWSRPPKCRAAVTAMVCTDLMDLVNGDIVYDMETNDNRPVNTVATYTCVPGYTLNGGTTRTCGSGGRWSESDPTCEAIECPPLLTITNGMISYSPNVTPDYDLGTNATYTCEAGFYLEGDEVRVCMDDDGMDTIGVWSGREPSCAFAPSPVRSVLFQLRLTNINNCPDWVDQDGRIEAVMSAFAAEVESHCGCGFSIIVMTAPLFRCFPGSDRAVTFRATLTDSRLLTPIQEWIQTNGFIPIQNVLIEVDKSCPVQISSLADTECTNNQPTAAGSSDIAAVVGGVVGGVVIVLIIVVGITIVVIVIAVLVFKSRREKLTVHRTTKYDLPPVSLKGVVSTGEIQSYEIMEMGHEYEEVSKFQRAVGGEYEIIGAPSQTTDSENKTPIKTELSPPTPPTPPTPQPSQASKPAGNDIEFTECVASTHSRPPQRTSL